MHAVKGWSSRWSPCRSWAAAAGWIRPGKPARHRRAGHRGGGEDDEGASPVRVGLRLARLGRPSEKLFELDELTDLAEREESEEELRLAHVAATRAAQTPRAERHLLGLLQARRGSEGRGPGDREAAPVDRDPGGPGIDRRPQVRSDFDHRPGPASRPGWTGRSMRKRSPSSSVFLSRRRECACRRAPPAATSARRADERGPPPCSPSTRRRRLPRGSPIRPSRSSSAAVQVPG